MCPWVTGQEVLSRKIGISALSFPPPTTSCEPDSLMGEIVLEEAGVQHAIIKSIQNQLSQQDSDLQCLRLRYMKDVKMIKLCI